jgi:WD40 repeat protein
MVADCELGQSGKPKATVFISYSRKDMAFADQLETALTARGFEPLIDRAEIYAFEDWWKRIEALIGKADTVVFVLSPDAVASDVALKEVTHAASLNKRFAPIAYRRVEDRAIPEALQRLNFIFFDDPARFDESADRLAEALQTDIGWVRQHTEFGEAARRWAAAGQPGGLLLRSPVLEEAEHWIASRPRGAPEPTAETQGYVAESRRGATRRRNILTGSLLVGLLLALGLAGIAYWQRNLAIKQRDATLIAQSQFLIDRSRQDLAAAKFPSAIGLALAALPEDMASPNRPYLPEAELALNTALQSTKERFVLEGHEAEIVDLNFSSDGRKLVTASRDGSARVWDVQTGTTISIFRGGREANSAAFNPASDLVVVTFSKEDTKVYEIASGRLVAELPGPAHGMAKAYFSQDGQSIIGEGNEEMRVWVLEGARALVTWPGVRLARSDDGRRVATVTRDPETVFVWDVQSGHQLAAFTGHSDRVTDATFSGNGASLVTCSLDRTARVWNVEASKKAPVIIQHGVRVTGCGMNPDGSQIATVTTDGNGRIFDARTGGKIADLASDELPIGPVEYVDGGRLILTQSGTFATSRPATLWDAQSGRLVANLHGRAFVSDSGKEFLVASEETAFPGMRLFGGYDVQQIVLIGEGPERPTSIAMSGDASYYAAAFDKNVVLWSRDGSGFVTDLSVAPGAKARFDPKGQSVLVWKQTALLWDVEHNRIECEMKGHTDQVNQAVFSPDGRRLVTAAQDATARLWSLENGCGLIRELKGHTRDVRDVVYSPDGLTIVTGSADRSVRFWNGVTGYEIASAITGFGRPVDRVMFSTDGAFFAAKTNDNIRIFDAKTHQEVASPDNERLVEVLKQKFDDGLDHKRRSPNGRLSMDFSNDGHDVTVSNVQTGAVIAQFLPATTEQNNTPFDASFNLDGSRILIEYRSIIRVAQVRKSTQALIDYARQIVPRCLTPNERQQAHLEKTPPRWCSGKWPNAEQSP